MLIAFRNTTCRALDSLECSYPLAKVLEGLDGPRRFSEVLGGFEAARLSPNLFPQKEVRIGSSEHPNASYAARGALHATSRTSPIVFLKPRNAFCTSPEVLLNPKGVF